MKTLLAALVIAWIHCSYAKLLISGDPIPALRSESFKVECLLQDSEYSIDDVQIEWGFWSKENAARRVKRRFCLGFSPDVVRTENTLSWTYQRFFSDLTFRCVLDGPNVTTPEYSEILNVTSHYLSVPQLYREGKGGYLYSTTLWVEPGDDVVVKCTASSSEEPDISWYKKGDDWILPSPVLELYSVSALDDGIYICYAEHPLIPSLSKNVTMTLHVLSGRRPKTTPAGRHQGLKRRIELGYNTEWYKYATPQMIFITAGCVLGGLVLISAIAAFVCSCAKKIKTSKGPIDDHSAKKPIYKSSTESVPVTCGDKQPLV